jgi:arabinose-5-phosphate isomerase
MNETLQFPDPQSSTPADDRLAYAREVICGEAAALDSVARRLDVSFLDAVDLIFQGSGRVAVTGTGKSADVGQKIAGTLNSTGTRAYFIDPTRAVHGDLGMVHSDDVALVLSYSGESEEIVRLLPPLRRATHAMIAITGNVRSTLARQARVAIVMGPLEEVCPLGLAPSTSTTATIALGDALAFVLSRMRNFGHEDFARFHPAGSLGRKLLRVEAVMRRGSALRVASCDDSVREVFARARLAGRRTGAVMLTDSTGRLCGLFTDSDLARLIEQRRDAALDRPIREVMTANPFTVAPASPVTEAVEILQHHKISELPVVDPSGQPVGLIDITDVIAFLPAEDAERKARVA